MAPPGAPAKPSWAGWTPLLWQGRCPDVWSPKRGLPQKLCGSCLSQKLLASVVHTLTCADYFRRSPGSKMAPADAEAKPSRVGFSILLIFSKNHLLVSLILCSVRFVSNWLISAPTDYFLLSTPLGCACFFFLDLSRIILKCWCVNFLISLWRHLVLGTFLLPSIHCVLQIWVHCAFIYILF